MKLSVESYVLCGKFGDFAGFDAIKNAGFDAVDYSYYWNNECERVLGDGYITYARSLREHLDAIGLECNQAHAPFSLPYTEGFSESNQKYLYLVRSLESAAILGAKVIVVHALSVPENVNFEEYNIRFYKSLIPYCEKFGICVAVENLFRFDPKRKHAIGKIGSPDELNRIVHTINSPFIVACIDVGHASLTGFEPEDFISGTDPKIIRALHIQDNDYITDLHVLPYVGQLNWNNIMRALKKSGYNGELTMEIFNFLSRFPDALVSDALVLSVKVGRYLIDLYNKA